MGRIYRVDESFDASIFQGASCAFGVFDGVHRGHRYLLDCARETAAGEGSSFSGAAKPERLTEKDPGNSGVSLALTFDIDPDETFHADRLKKLMTNEQRIAALAESGVDAVVVLPFTGEFSSQEPEQFLRTTFQGFAPYALHVGFDIRFGKKAAGNIDTLREWSRSTGTLVYAHDLESADGKPITATRIRKLLGDGKIEEANELLGHPYAISGTVERGRGDGGDFGFKTANLRFPGMLRTLGDGVYAAWAYVDGERYKAAVSVGVAPTFADKATATMEPHILDFEGDLYGQPITLEFMHWLRPMMTFASTEELIATVMGNIAWVRENLK